MLICLQEKACVYFECFSAFTRPTIVLVQWLPLSMRSTSFACLQHSAAINTLLKLNRYYGFKYKPVSYTDNAEFPTNNRES